MEAEKLLEKQLQDLDKEIQEAEKALLHLNKQAGNKVTKISNLKEKRLEVSSAYCELLGKK